MLDPPLPMWNARMGLRCGPLVIVVPRYFHVEGICFVGMFKIRGKLNSTAGQGPVGQQNQQLWLLRQKPAEDVHQHGCDTPQPTLQRVDPLLEAQATTKEVLNRQESF